MEGYGQKMARIWHVEPNGVGLKTDPVKKRMKKSYLFCSVLLHHYRFSNERLVICLQPYKIYTP
jgi:hypothetical protein